MFDPKTVAKAEGGGGTRPVTASVAMVSLNGFGSCEYSGRAPFGCASVTEQPASSVLELQAGMEATRAG